MSVKVTEGRFTTYTTVRTVTYGKGGTRTPPRELRMLESPPKALLEPHYLIVLGHPAGGQVTGPEKVIEVASTKQDAYRMLDAAENVLKGLAWGLIEEVNA